mmetsp:Transcript_5628/g.8644  ORF Transcript_5628/g.8644 Transcript_5628/m.8644 type:complete len:97 (+) Transcript_5628:523-813(+)
MCSKYLCVPLRYRLICNSSRSAVQDDVRGVFPLFKERVEREQLDRGVLLLGRNIDCLLSTRGLEVDSKAHLLARTVRLFNSSRDGSRKLFSPTQVV